MALQPGTRLGPYEVVTQIGVGGMGEVYRATDTKLKRSVAIKVLPESLATDAERLARFQREAEVLAALNHPNIAHIYGLEDADGIKAFVMELVEGPTLADRIAQGAIPIDEALPIAKQVAEALEAAHEQGIVHRDLKPANIKVRADGTVKVLDFGLAKAMEPVGAMSSSVSESPTITSPAMMTGVGVILGTAAYMSPEQARGRTVDKRADIWAFGAVLFEMLTGSRAFGGDDVSDVLASVLAREPDWTLLPRGLSPVLGTFLRRCLYKDPKQRIGDAQSLRLALDGAFETAAFQATQSVVVAQPVRRRWFPVMAALVIGGLSVGMVSWNLWPVDVAPTVSRFDYDLPDGMFLRASSRTSVALSPDGTQFAFTTTAGLYVRTMGELDARAISGAEQARSGPFFSPDGQSVGYFDAGELKRIALNGGAPTVICATTDPLGASWGRDNMILFAQPGGIMRVSANGGTPEFVIKAGKGEVVEGPQLLPDNDSVLFSLAANAGPTRWDQAQIVVQSIRTGERKVVWRGGSGARYLPTGHLLYVLGNTLFAIAFDANELEIKGQPVAMVEDVMRPASLASAGIDSSGAQYTVSDNATLVYVAGASPRLGKLVLVGRNGAAEEITTIPVGEYPTIRLSPDRRSVLTFVKNDAWIFEIATGRGTRLTRDGLATGPMAWHPSGSWVAYTADDGGSENVWMAPSDGSRDGTRRLTKFTGVVDVDSWSPDGRLLTVHHHRPDGGTSILMLRTDADDAEPQTFVENELAAEGATFSPDGRYVAYMAMDTGQREIYIRPYPGASGRTTVSIGGGREPVWAGNGELFYRNLAGDRMMAVAVTTEPLLRVGKPQEVFTRRYAFMPTGSPRPLYDVAHDGQRFLMVSASDERGQPQPGSRLIIIQHLSEELKRLVPTN